MADVTIYNSAIQAFSILRPVSSMGVISVGVGMSKNIWFKLHC